MTQMRWRPWVLGVIGTVAVAYGVMFLISPAAQVPPVECAVVNETAETLERVAVTVFHRTYRAEGLAPGGSLTFAFDTAGDDHYHVEVQAASGPPRAADVGYVTTGTHPKDRIEIGPDAIRFETTGG